MRFTTFRVRGPAPWALVVAGAIGVLFPSHEGRADVRHVPGYRYVSPLPGARFVSRWNNVVIRQGGIITGTPDPSALSVTGSVSGRHEGSLVVSDDARTLVYTPHEPFAPGETVSVRVLPGNATRGGERFRRWPSTSRSRRPIRRTGPRSRSGRSSTICPRPVRHRPPEPNRRARRGSQRHRPTRCPLVFPTSAS